MAAAQTMTSIHSNRMQDPRYIRLVNSSPSSNGATSSQLPIPPPLTAPLGYFNQPRKHEHIPIQHTSFDYTPSSPAWYVRSPPTANRLRLWLERTYYQYEVTWGLYVLTPGEKVVINSLVLVMLSLIVYGFTKVAVFQQAVQIITQYMAVLTREGLVTLRELGDLILRNILGQTELGGIEGMMEITQTKMITPTSAPAEMS